MSDIELIAKAESILYEHGIDFKALIKSYFEVNSDSKQIENTLPISKCTHQILPREEVCGILTGKVWMSDDFNDSIDDLVDDEDDSNDFLFT